MSTLRLYSQKQIAEALGVSREAVRKRAAKGLSRKGEAPWAISCRNKTRGGEAYFYAFEELPKDVRRALDRLNKKVKKKAAVAVAELPITASEAKALLARIEELEIELRQQKRALKRNIGARK